MTYFYLDFVGKKNHPINIVCIDETKLGDLNLGLKKKHNEPSYYECSSPKLGISLLWLQLKYF